MVVTKGVTLGYWWLQKVTGGRGLRVVVTKGVTLGYWWLQKVTGGRGLRVVTGVTLGYRWEKYTGYFGRAKGVFSILISVSPD